MAGIGHSVEKQRDAGRQFRLGEFYMASKDVYQKILDMDGYDGQEELRKSFERQLKWFSAIFKNETGLDANVLKRIKEELLIE